MKKLILGLIFIAAVTVFSACSSKSGKQSGAAADDKDPAKQTVPENSESALPKEPDDAGEPPAKEDAYHKITAEEAKKMIDEGGVTIVDVRRQDEYRAGHIPDSVLVPNESIGSEPPEALPDKDAVLLVHCRTGIRSKQASDKLVALGYKHIYDFGGIVDWPYETVAEQ